MEKERSLALEEAKEELRELEGLEDSGIETAEEEKPERPARNNYQQRPTTRRQTWKTPRILYFAATGRGIR